MGDDSYSKWLADAVADFSGYTLWLNNKSTHNYRSKPHPRLFTEVFVILIFMQTSNKFNKLLKCSLSKVEIETSFTTSYIQHAYDWEIHSMFCCEVKFSTFTSVPLSGNECRLLRFALQITVEWVSFSFESGLVISWGSINMQLSGALRYMAGHNPSSACDWHACVCA